MLDITLMFPNADAKQEKLKDTVGIAAIWDQKYLKSAS
jgi:hypothetical protein